VPDDVTAAPPCFEGGAPAPQDQAIRWLGPDDPDDRAKLDAWCWGVGPAYQTRGDEVAVASGVDSIAVVAWNVAVGGGDARRLIDDLRTGRLTGGQPPEHFVILLQEAHRTGSAVPQHIPTWAAAAGAIRKSPPAGGRLDVTALAWVEGLHLFYVPSMRNGGPGQGAPEDRGNAILSTLPLTGLTAVELPYERQRRVAVFANVEGRSSTGEPWRLRVVSAHLDNRAALSRIHRSFGAAQSNQARGLLSALDGETPTVVGGDLNTWYRETNAGAVRILQARFASVEDHPPGGTADLPLFLPDVKLDHLFFGLPDSWDARYEVAEDRYGSDHKPLVGWVSMAGTDIRTRTVDRDRL
jgi:endonuclease/exonuclease/phosphatase family metal-dependent hydrolase